MRVRAIRSQDEFSRFPGDPESFGSTIAELLDAGRSRPAWCLLAERSGEAIGRVGLVLDPTLPAELADLRGDLPESEARVFGLAVRRRDDWGSVGVELLRAALELRGQLPDDPQLRINAAVHSHPARRCWAARSAGFALFQEKEGVLWEDGVEPVEVPSRLRFRTMAELGPEALVRIVSRVAAGTLDRNDRYYSSRMSREDWARVYVSFFQLPEATFVGFRAGEPVGFVSLSPFDEPETATIAFIGVLPEHRGNGYVDDLLLAATAAGTRAGFRRILSDVDVENRPMLEAMARCGHRADATPWHVWHFRGPG